MTSSRYGHMVHEYYVSRLRSLRAERDARLAAVTSRSAAEGYVQEARKAVRTAFGPEPERTPLQARVTGSKTYGAFTIERVVFESRPNFLVTANLYLPNELNGPAPGVLGVCGHSQAGKAEEKYRAFCQGLATKGFVVLIIDPISQGERPQFFETDNGKLPPLTVGHDLIGFQQILTGDFLGAWRAWDAIRGLDYLLSRPEVDATHVGVTGNSGGGTLSSFVSALDSRITMAAPSCWVCSFLANLENEIPADAEQNPPGMVGAGFDEADMLLCYAPRPTLVLSQIDDFFDERAARRAFEEIRHVNELLGAHDAVEYFAGPHGHGYHQENREAMYAFFMKHSAIDAPAAEPPLEDVTEQELWALPTGNTAEAGSRRVFDFTRDAGADLARRRLGPNRYSMRDDVSKLLSIPWPVGAPHFRCLHHYNGVKEDPPWLAQFAVESEPGIQVILTTYGSGLRKMHLPTGPVIVYVGHTDAQEDLKTVPYVKELLHEREALVAVEPRGFGITMATACNSTDFFFSHGSDGLYAATGEILGESYLGRRVYDVLRALDCLIANGATSIRLVGRGVGSVIAVFAGAIHPSSPSVKLFDYLPSYRTLLEDPLACWPLSSLAYRALHELDLSEVYNMLDYESRLELERPWDARMRPA